MAWAAAAVVLWGFGSAFDKLAVDQAGPGTAFFARFYLQFLIILPFLVRGWEDHRAGMAAAPRQAPFWLLGSVVCYTAGMYAYYHALARGQASRIVPWTSVYPLVTFALSLLLLHETFTWTKFAGTVLAVAGVAALSR
jgi:transporter family protein